MEKSALQIARAAYQPKLPIALRGALKAVEGDPTQSVADQEEVQKLFPNTYGMPYLKFEPTDEAMPNAQMNVGVILSGGQAPGGHNVISGLFDGIKKLNPANKLYGFLMGPGGLVDHKYIEITPEIMDTYRTAAESGMLDAGCGVNGEQTGYLASVENTGFTQRMIGLVRSTLDQTYFEAYAASGATDISSDVIKRGGNTWYILNYSLTGTVGAVAITWINGYQIMLSCANITDISFAHIKTS